MVGTMSIVMMGVSASLCLLLPIIVFIVFKRKENISLKPVITGALIFIVFALVIERLLHMVVIGKNLITNPILFSIYGALAAGVFEETGRFVAFKTVLGKSREWKDGIAYGIGHGGIEAILIGAMSYVQSLIYSNMINAGTFDTVLGANVPAEKMTQIAQLKDTLIQTSAGIYLIGFAERVFALGIQVALSVLVLYAVKNRKILYFLAAILFHALIDFPAGLYQMKLVNMYETEGLIAVLFIISVVFVAKSKKIFDREKPKVNV